MNILNEKSIRFWLVLLLLAVGLALIGCSSRSEEIESTEPAPTAVPPTQAPASGVPAPDGIVDVVWEWRCSTSTVI